MKKKDRKIPPITDITRRFNEAVEMIISKGAAGNYREVADSIKWNESGMSTARKEEINVPPKYIKSLEEVYKVKIITGAEDQIVSDIMQRILRLEAQAEIFHSTCAELKAISDGIPASDADFNLKEKIDKVYNRLFRSKGDM